MGKWRADPQGAVGRLGRNRIKVNVLNSQRINKKREKIIISNLKYSDLLSRILLILVLKHLCPGNPSEPVKPEFTL